MHYNYIRTNREKVLKFSLPPNVTQNRETFLSIMRKDVLLYSKMYMRKSTTPQEWHESLW